MSSKFRIFVFCMALVGSQYVKGQKVFCLHPIVGDTITYDEAYDFYLFRDIPVDTFIYVLIEIQDEGYRARFKTESEQLVKLDSSSVAGYQENIEKIYRYVLNYLNRPQNIRKDTLMVQSVDLQLMTPEQKRKMIGEALMYNRKMMDANERGLMLNDRDDYINNSGGAILFRSKKTKGE